MRLEATHITERQFAAALSSAVAAALSGCGDAVSTWNAPSGSTPATVMEPQAPTLAGVASPTSEEYVITPNGIPCEWSTSWHTRQTTASLARGLNPPTPIDYIAVYEVLSKFEAGESISYLNLVEVAGEQCRTGPPDCPTSLESLLVPPRASELYYRYGPAVVVVTDANGPRAIASQQQLEELLFPIDTANEVALLLSVQVGHPSCESIFATDDGYTASFVVPGECDEPDLEYRAIVSRDGSFTQQLIGELLPSCVTGRLSAGLDVGSGDPALRTNTGDHFARLSELETAAVLAFSRLAQELSLLSAPETLIAGAKRAAQQEVRHARLMASLAAHHGRKPRPVRYVPSRARSLFAIALENAVEGCVRETYGAASALWQSVRARSHETRRAYALIAPDETEHAHWSLLLHEWAMQKLPAAEARAVEAERRCAMLKMAREHIRESRSAVADELGIPTAAEAAALWRSVMAAADGACASGASESVVARSLSPLRTRAKTIELFGRA